MLFTAGSRKPDAATTGNDSGGVFARSAAALSAMLVAAAARRHSLRTALALSRGHGVAVAGRAISTSTLVQATVAAAGVLLGPSLLPTIRGRGAPFVATAHEKCDALFGEGGLLRDDATHSWLTRRHRARGAANLRFVDLGSGGGGMLRAASRLGGYQTATGFEINPWLACYSRLRDGSNEQTRWQSLWDAELHDADVVLVFGNPPMLDALGAKLRSELRDGAIVVSNAYELPRHWLGTPVRSTLIETAAWSRFLYSDVSSGLFCYLQTAEAETEAFLEARVGTKK